MPKIPVPEDGTIETAYPELASRRDETHVQFICPTCKGKNSTNVFDRIWVVCGVCWEKFSWPMD